VPPTQTNQTASHIATPPPQAPEKGKLRNALPTILLFILAPAIALSITAFAFQSYQVDGQSMETTLQDHDRLVVSKVARSWSKITHHAYVPKRGNIIIFNQAGLFDSSGNQEKQLIKRVVGLPGERVVVKNGQITIYNKEHPSGFNPDRTTGYTITASTTPGDTDVTLKEDEIFVCGDNRTNSEDSRYFGPVNVERIVGKLYLRILPINKTETF
jgi:signal peptidase I